MMLWYIEWATTSVSGSELSSILEWETLGLKYYVGLTKFQQTMNITHGASNVSSTKSIIFDVFEDRHDYQD